MATRTFSMNTLLQPFHQSVKCERVKRNDGAQSKSIENDIKTFLMQQNAKYILRL